MLIPLESNNAKALFILCTTEPNKIIETVRSRVHRYNFPPVNKQTIFNLLKEIAKKESIEISPAHLKAVTNASGGSVRDAIRNLEEFARTGTLKNDYRTKVLDLMISKNFIEAFTLTSQMATEGVDFRDTTIQLYSDVRELMVLSGKKVKVKEGTTSANIIANVPIGTLSRILKIISNSLSEFRLHINSLDIRIIFENCLTEIIETLLKAK